MNSTTEVEAGARVLAVDEGFQIDDSGDVGRTPGTCDAHTARRNHHVVIQA